MINIMVWNARGVGNVSTTRRLKRLCRIHSVSVLVLLEPIVSVDSMDSLRDALHFSDSLFLNNNKIWVFGGSTFNNVLGAQPVSPYRKGRLASARLKNESDMSSI